MMGHLYLSRKQLQTLGLSPYLARLISLECPVHQKKGNANLYGLTDLRLAAQAYGQRSRIQAKTKASLQAMIQQFMIWENTVIPAAFGQAKSESRVVVTNLINKVSETSKFQMRALELRGKLKHV